MQKKLKVTLLAILISLSMGCMHRELPLEEAKERYTTLRVSSSTDDDFKVDFSLKEVEVLTYNKKEECIIIKLKDNTHRVYYNVGYKYE